MYFFGLAVLIIMVMLTTVHVIGRYAFNYPVKGLVEMSGLLLLIVISLAGAYTVITRGHVTVTLLLNRFPPRVRSVINYVTYSLCLIFTALAAWQTFRRSIWLSQVGQTTEILGIPIPPFYILLGICWVLFSLAIILQIITFFKSSIDKGETG